MDQAVERHRAAQLACPLTQARFLQDRLDPQPLPELIPHVDRPGLARLLAAHGAGHDGDLFLAWFDAGGQRLLILLGAAPSRAGLELGDEAFQFGIRAGRGEQILLAGEGVLQLTGELQPLLFGTRGEVAERADDFLAGAFGSEVAFDEEVVEVGLALVGPRGFADVHSLDTIKNDGNKEVKSNVE
jgi:hypothetical protein